MTVDATGKVRVGNLGVGDLGTEDAVRIVKSDGRRTTNQTTGDGDSASPIVDKVDLETSRTLQDVLNLDTFNAERKAKIDALKAKIEKGEYNPSSEAIAKATAGEIVQEILYAKAVGDNRE